MKVGAVIIWFLASAAWAQPYWITGYYQPNGGLGHSDIPWKNYTHVVHFEVAVPTSEGAIGDPYGGRTQQETNGFIAAGHAAGRKVLIGIKDNLRDLAAWPNATAPHSIDKFVANIAALVENRGGTSGSYDGVDIDWEARYSAPRWLDLIARLRAAMPSKLITAAMGSGLAEGMPAAASRAQSMLQQMNVMCYDFDTWGNRTWFNSALFAGGNAPNDPKSCEQLAGWYMKAAVAPKKLGIGIPFYGGRFPGCTQPLQHVSGCPGRRFIQYRELVKDRNRWREEYRRSWGGNQGYFLSIPPPIGPEFISYTGTEQIQAAGSWLKARGFGGAMVFAIEYEYLPHLAGEARFPLSTALRAALEN